jgi:hypothetical protein
MQTLNMIPIQYDLYYVDEGKLYPVTQDAHLGLQDAIRRADPAKVVDQVDSPSDQADIVHDHVTTMVPATIHGHTIGYADREDSKYDPTSNVWIAFEMGASVTYPIDDEPDAAELFLAVATHNVA